jgi:hypothetical protein
VLHVPSGSCTQIRVNAASREIAIWGDSLANRLAQDLRNSTGREVYNGAVEAEVSTATTSRFLSDSLHRGSVTIFWLGTANRLYTAYQNHVAEQVVSDVSAAVACMRASGNERFLVLSTLNDAQEVRGSGGHARTIAVNESIAAAFPENYLDVRGFLISLYDSTSEVDRANVAVDVLPESIRADLIHLRQSANAAVASMLRQAIEARGW